MASVAALSTAVWRLLPGQLLHHQSWDNEEFVLYNNLSGDTHLLDAATLETLQALARGDAGVAALAGALGVEGAAGQARLGALLAELAELALVEIRPC
ncbi:HPr-rel-A system PqqD family peptide chaperone [Janthinobacterium sp.]|uniref:HPr-rel-A system PqqD family peptide chaperone n=1 Tax=Janthinobacterium sp. TaxID=1871054 RepID=UPI00293D94D4|nr:HPr-rel-A system PqqD family peptide chaperone [Janthinobacterium sp.]